MKAATFDRAVFDANLFDCGDGPTPLADLKQAYPLKAARTYPLKGVKQHYPLGGQ